MPDAPNDWSQPLRARLSALRLNAAREAEIVEELSQHLEQRYDELRHDGASDADARRLAMEELLEPGTLAERMRLLRQAHTAVPIEAGTPRAFLFGDLWQDVRYAGRMLRRQPGFAAAALLTLALGIGVNSAIFALVDATLLRPLPFVEPERAVMVWERTQASERGRVARRNLIDWNERSRTFEVIGGFVPNVGGMVTTAPDGTAETIARQWVTAGVFDALGVRPIVGRTFLQSDDAQRSAVIVLNETFWRTRFNSDPGVVGRSIRLDGTPHTIVGVVPQEAQLIGRTSIWALMPILQTRPDSRGGYVLQAIGRVKPGVTLDQAAGDIADVAEALAREFPRTNTGRSVALVPLHEAVIGAELRTTSLLFLAIVGFVLLICCANVANFLLTRVTVRRRELAIRSALGADRVRVVRQLVTESLVLSLIGGALGLTVGAAILEAAPSVIPYDLLPAAVKPVLDVRVALFCAATALFVGLLFGLAPAWQASAFSPAQVLGAGSRTVTGRVGTLRALFVSAQVASAVMVLFGAGLLLRSLVNVESIDRGYRAESVLTMIVDPRTGDQEPLLQFYGAVEKEAMTFPGVRSVAWATTLPLGRSYQGRFFFEIVGDPPAAESNRPTADYQIVSPTYFQTLDLPIVMGRGFNDQDRTNSVAICMVNEAFVRRYVQGRSPIGLRIAIRPTLSAEAPTVVREIVGVARQVKGRPDEAEDLIQIYVPLAQHTPGDIFMILRPASGSAEALAPVARAAIARVDKAQEVSVRSVMTLADVAWDATGRYRFRAVLVMTFAALALLLAMIGLFGVLAYSVQQRVRDLGVRRALGANTSDLVRVVTSSVLPWILAGVAIGLVASVWLSRLVGAMLFGVQPLDPVTFAAVIVVTLFTAGVSLAGPTWRATRIDPAITLRAE